MDVDERLKKLILRLHDIQTVKFGAFTLKNGMRTPIYVDLRVTVSYPDILDQVGEFMWESAKSRGISSDVVCGVPYGALPVATCVSVRQNVPMLFRRKEVKGYGTRKLVEGKYKDGDKCLIIEDVIVSGQSIIETAEALKDAGLNVSSAVVFLDRQQGGKEILEREGIHLESVVNVMTLLKVLHEAGRVDNATVKIVETFLEGNQCLHIVSNQVLTTKPNVLPFAERSALCNQPVAKKLFAIMAAKKTNVALAADLTQCAQLLRIASLTGPHICMLKIHVELLQDYNRQFIIDLQKLSDEHDFLIYEDHKYSDIGAIVQQEYEKGFYSVVDWAHLTNAHPLPGPATLNGLKKTGIAKGRACLLIAEMSTAGSLWTQEYVDNTVRMGEANDDYVIGFVCQSQLTTSPHLFNVVSGVKIEAGRDDLGQRYLTPADAVIKRGADIVVVGRGIWNAEDPAKAAKQYQAVAYEAHNSLL